MLPFPAECPEQLQCGFRLVFGNAEAQSSPRGLLPLDASLQLFDFFGSMETQFFVGFCGEFTMSLFTQFQGCVVP